MSTDDRAVLLIPIDITSDMITTGTSVPVVDSAAGEVAWDDTTPWDIDDEVNHEGWIWEAQKSNTDVEPGTDATTWLQIRPSNRMAPFDSELNTVTRRPGEIKYVLRPQFFSGLYIVGMVGEQLTIQVYDKPVANGGVLVEDYSSALWDQARGLYELLFMPLARRTQHSMRNLRLYPDPEVHISITAANSAMCEVALITLGHWETLIGAGTWGGTEYGANAEIKSYSYLKRREDGTVERKRRGGGDNIDCSVVIPTEEANLAKDLLHMVQGRPVGFIASGLYQYEFLNGFGDVSGSVAPESFGMARVRLHIEGAVQGVRT